MEILYSQPIINIGILGSVSDGKSTLIKKLTGIETQRHSSEKERNITIKQGYGNMKIWKKNDEYISTNSTYIDESKDTILINHISFVDCPGHQDYIKTMLTSTSLMHGAIVVVAVDQPISTKTTLIQHLLAAKVNGLDDKLIICLNKIDLVSKDIVITRKKELDNLLKQLDIKTNIIIPSCFNKNIGLKYIIRNINELFDAKQYIKKENIDPIFRINRSFDTNKPGTDINNINGGVIGGTLIQGILQVGDIIEISPGIISSENIKTPIKTIIKSIRSENESLDIIYPGGLIGICTDIDPFYTKNDALKGNVAGINLEKLINIINIKITFINKNIEWKPQINNIYNLQNGTSISLFKLISFNKNIYNIELIDSMYIIKNDIVCICTNNKPINILASGIVI
jgi:translation initiation factor 2 subunit 3